MTTSIIIGTFNSRFFLTLYCLLFLARNVSLQVPLQNEDAAFSNYLHSLTSNYSIWLSSNDPFPFAALPYVLSLRGYNVLSCVDVDIEFHNQYMENHSDAVSNLISANSNLTSYSFDVGRRTMNHIITFGGYYVVKEGFFRPGNSSEIPFTGKGNWLLRTNYTWEKIKYNGFSLNEQGYINVSSANVSWSYKTKWVDIEFEGLTIGNANSNVTREDIKSVSKALAEVFTRFLKAIGTNESQNEVILPRYLIMKYLDESLRKIKLSDIVENWMPDRGKARQDH